MRILIFMSLMLSPLVKASVSVSFFRMYSPEGKLVQLEEDGEFFHVALQIEDGRWVHTNPRKGVELVKDLKAIGNDPIVLTSPNTTPIPLSQIEPYIGLPFDFNFNWDDQSCMYCSELIGNLLGIEPKPTKFSTPAWVKKEVLPGMEKGLSPDDVYDELRARGYKMSGKMTNCDRFLVTPFMHILLEAK